MGNPKSATQRLAREYADQGDPNGWFEEFYARACGDIGKVYWADLKPNPLLLDWLKERGASDGMRAITIGCGLGDDAEALSRYGYRVTAFDISPSAIAMCRGRVIQSISCRCCSTRLQHGCADSIWFTSATRFRFWPA